MPFVDRAVIDPNQRGPLQTLRYLECPIRLALVHVLLGHVHIYAVEVLELRSAERLAKSKILCIVDVVVCVHKGSCPGQPKGERIGQTPAIMLQEAPETVSLFEHRLGHDHNGD
eukprot:CAMPEP_0113832300 /NCGR_PEP_ID=MMETSP0328-20130328/7308_1 /TAXON_ID=39455 /ORGANISM="Alexandrium minutum" /LENGTH=113 /DNA_ID=CAMNT_0000800509 /DNA_START=369 /DNA_END=710 /DNA_ORIENTATION=- /assembly_acc=CAM_ASM_000350